MGAHRSVLRNLLRLCGVLAVGRGSAGERARGRTFTVLALSVTAVLACALQGALSPGLAQAEPPKLISYGSFNSGSAFGIGVDQSSGDMYVAGLVNLANFGVGPVNKFDAAGNLISPPSPFGEANNAGVAVNPTNGDVYVLGAPGLFTPTSVYTYDPSTGALLSSFEVPGSSNIAGIFTGVQIAADAAGNVYVPVAPQNEVLEYSSSGTPLNTFTGGSSSGALKNPTGIAIDASGNLWVADNGNSRIEELSPAGAPIGEIHSEGVQSVALDAHGDVFALVENSADFCGSIAPPCAHLMEYSSGGTQLADVGAGSFDAGGAGTGKPSISMVAFNNSNGHVYVTDDYNGRVWVFGPPSAPVVGRELVSEVGTSEVKLGALVNPGGINTTYRFEYGTTTAYGQTVPLPEGSAGEGISSHSVWAGASGLAPGATYHYRVVVTNELDVVYGADETFTTLTAEQAACPNEQFRGGFSARLPDCRAYELVTPPTKNSVEAESAGQIAADGDAVAFVTNDPLPNAPTGADDYIATRGAGGWSSEDVIPLESYSEPTCLNDQTGPASYSAELSKAIIEYGKDSRSSGTPQSLETQSCNVEGLQVVPGEPVGYKNLLLRDNLTGSYQLINALPAGITPSDAHLMGASADLSHVVFTEMAPLAEGATYGVENLYEWDEGAVRLLTWLPDGKATQGGLAAISSDGSRILFGSGDALYDRIDGQRTVQVDESQGGSGSSGGGEFETASADGTEIFFTDERRLTANATAAAGEPDLYECALPEGASKCELSDLTVAKSGEHADVLKVLGLGAQDSLQVYFVARGVLASNTREYTNSEGNVVIERAQAGRNNLYLWSGDTTRFIAFGTPESDEELGRGVASPDGTSFALLSSKSLTGYDNKPAADPPVNEVFLYDAASSQLVCASCNPTGEAPIVGGGAISNGGVSDGGRLFFATRESLVPSDTNGQADVYEYEDGHVYLISSGTSSQESSLVGASESGDDVFFLSTQALVPQDTLEGMQAIYDARVDGGFPNPASPPACTTADSCRAPVSPQPAIYGAPSSQTFSGAGNLASPEAKPKAKPKAKPVKCKGDGSRRGEKKGKCVRKSAKKAKKSAHTNRRGK